MSQIRVTGVRANPSDADSDILMVDLLAVVEALEAIEAVTDRVVRVQRRRDFIAHLRALKESA